MLLPRDRWQQRGSLTEWHLTEKCRWSKRCVSELFHMEKNGMHCHPSTLAEHLWRPNSRCEHSEDVDGASQQWCHHSSCGTVITFTGTDFYKHGMQVLVQCWEKSEANSGDYIEKHCFVAKNLLYQIITVLSVSVVVSMETDRSHHFCSIPHICSQRLSLFTQHGTGKPEGWTAVV